jgi:anti-anti-sigma regulatory factor
VLALCGDHDVSTAPALRTALNRILVGRGNVIVDLCRATSIDSAILGALFPAALNPGGIIAIAVAPEGAARRLIHKVGLGATVPTFESRDAAVAYATRGHS